MTWLIVVLQIALATVAAQEIAGAIHPAPAPVQHVNPRAPFDA